MQQTALSGIYETMWFCYLDAACKAKVTSGVFLHLLFSGDFSLSGGSKGVSEGGSQTSSETGEKQVHEIYGHDNCLKMITNPRTGT